MESFIYEAPGFLLFFYFLCPDMENHGIQYGVLTFSHDCMYNIHSL